MKIDRYERIFLYSSAVVLAIFFSAVILSVSEAGIHLPSDEDTLDPKAVDTTPPFDNPGVFPLGDGTYLAVIVAEAWGYTPNEIIVPAGAEVTFVATSRDVIHGFMVPRTTINAMLIPGQVTRVSYTFDEPGEHDLLCHEFCGIGHHNMFARVVVEG